MKKKLDVRYWIRSREHRVVLYRCFFLEVFLVFRCLASDCGSFFRVSARFYRRFGFRGLHRSVPPANQRPIRFYWVLPGFTGFYWVLVGLMEFLVVLIKFSVVLLDFTGFQWLSSDSWWVWYSFIRFKLVSVFVFTAFDWVSVAFIGLWMVLFDITGFQLIWSGLSGWNQGYQDV